MPSNRKRVAGYVRLSRWRDESLAPETQRHRITEWAAFNGYEIAEWFEDIDVSGKDLERPSLARLRAQWHHFGIAAAVKIDRWARSTIGFSTLADESHKAGCELVAIDDKLDLTDPRGRFVADILAAFAQFERDTIRSRILDGKATSKAAGRRQGGAPPYGYRKARDADGNALPGEIEPDPGEVPVWREAAEKIATGTSMREITAWLNDGPRVTLRYPRKDGTGPGVLSVANVRRALTGEPMAAIIGEQLRRAVIATAGPKKREDWSNATTLLSGVLRCGNCGGPMGSGVTSAGAHRYRCSRMVASKACDRSAAIQAYLIEALVVGAWLDANEDLQQTVGVYADDLDAEREAALKAESQRLNKIIGALSRDEQRATLDRLDAIDAELAELTTRDRTRMMVLTDTGKTWGAVWHAADTIRRRELITERLLPNGLTINPAGGKIRPVLERLASVAEFEPAWFDPSIMTPADLQEWLGAVWAAVKPPSRFKL